MCGIAGIYIKDHALNSIDLNRLSKSLLLGIEPRGQDATGMLVVNRDGSHHLEKQPIPAHQFIKTCSILPESTKMVLLHTRLKTKGEETEFYNNHPVMYKSCFVTHNGVISNDDAVFNTLDLPRFAQVDSEAIAAALSSYTLDRADKAFEAIQGSMAVAATDPNNDPTRLILARGDYSPLVCMDMPKMILWASTTEALKDAWGAAIGTPPSNIGCYEYVQEGTILDIAADEVTRKSFDVPFSWKERRTYSSFKSTRFTGIGACDMCGERPNYRQVYEGSLLCPDCVSYFESVAAKNDDDYVSGYDVCSICNFVAKEDEIEESVNDAGDTIYVCRKCDSAMRLGLVCGVTTNDNDLKELLSGAYDPVEEWMLYGHHKAQLSEGAMQLAAGELGYTTDFLRWLMHDTAEELEDAYLSDMYDDAIMVYRHYRDFLTEEYGTSLPLPEHVEAVS